MPQILINREPLKHLTFDVELLGDCDVIVQELCLRLGDGWTSICDRATPARQIQRADAHYSCVKNGLLTINGGRVTEEMTSQ